MPPFEQNQQRPNVVLSEEEFKTIDIEYQSIIRGEGSKLTQLLELSNKYGNKLVEYHTIRKGLDAGIIDMNFVKDAPENQQEEPTKKNLTGIDLASGAGIEDHELVKDPETGEWIQKRFLIQ